MCLDNSGAARALAGTRAARPIFTIKEANKAMSGFPQAHLHIIRLFPINLSFHTTVASPGCGGWRRPCRAMGPLVCLKYVRLVTDNNLTVKLITIYTLCNNWIVCQLWWTSRLHNSKHHRATVSRPTVPTPGLRSQQSGLLGTVQWPVARLIMPAMFLFYLCCPSLLQLN